MQMILDLRNKMELVVALCSKINYRLREESLKLGPRASRAGSGPGLDPGRGSPGHAKPPPLQ